MAYTLAGFGILFVTAVLAGVVDWEVEHSFPHAIIAWYTAGLFMIFGADWLLQRTAWGRRHAEGMGSPDPDTLN